MGRRLYRGWIGTIIFLVCLLPGFAFGAGWTNPSSSKTYTILVGDQTVSSAQDWDDLIIVGDLALNAGCDTSTLDYVRITGDVTINAAGETVTFNDVVYFGTKTVTAGTLTEAGNDDYIDPPRDIYLDADATGKDASNATGLSDDPWVALASVSETTHTIWSGATIYLQAGDTFTGQLDIRSSGTSSYYITVDSYGTGNDPIIDGNASTEALYVFGKSYHHYKNITFQNGSSVTGYIATNGADVSYIKASDCTFKTGAGNGLTIISRYQDLPTYAAHNMTFTDCNFSTNANTGAAVQAYYYSHDIDFTNCTATGNNTGAGERQGFAVSTLGQAYANTGWTLDAPRTLVYYRALPAPLDDETVTMVFNDNPQYHGLTDKGSALADGDTTNFYVDTAQSPDRLYINIGVDPTQAGYTYWVSWADTVGGKGAQSVTFTNCIAQTATNASSHGEDGIGIYLDREANNCVIEQSIIKNNQGRAISIRGGGGHIIKANVMYGNSSEADNTGHQIYIWEESDGVDIFNNTIIGRNSGGGSVVYTQDEANDIVVKNNILYDADDYALEDTGDGTNLVADYNLYYLNDASVSNWSQGANKVESDPLFINTANDDYRLTAKSPARRAGDSTIAIDTDIRGRSRGNYPDIGAYQSTMTIQILPYLEILFLPGYSP